MIYLTKILIYSNKEKILRNKILFIISGLLLSTASWAITLNEAKTQGLVGEQLSGMLGVVKASPEVESLVKDINSKRTEAYEKIAIKNNLTAEQVGKLAGEKTTNKTKSGLYLKDKNRKWVVKP